MVCVPDAVMQVEYARGLTPRDYNHITIYDGMDNIEEGEYSLRTLGANGWSIININGWSESVANVLLMRYVIVS
jgi:hypothetical protein